MLANQATARVEPGLGGVRGPRVGPAFRDEFELFFGPTDRLTGPCSAATLHVFYDLKSGRYLVDGLDNARAPYVFSNRADPRDFTPNELNYYLL